MKAGALRTSLLAGTAAAALLCCAPQAAQAQMYSSGPGVYLSLEGRYLMGRGDKVSDGAASLAGSPFTAALGNVDARADKGWGGKAMLGYRFGNSWDVGFGFSGNWLKGRASKSANATNTMSTYNGRIQNTTTSSAQKIKVKLSYQVADFEAGYNWKMGAASTMRLFGGLRVARFNQTAKASFNSQQTQTVGPISNTTTIHGTGKRKTTFLGIGPRLGANGQLGLGVGGFNVFGGLSGALLIGRYKDRHSFATSTPEDGGSTSIKDKRKTKLVPNVEGEIGLGYTVVTGGGSTIGLQLGYRAEKWWGVSSDAPIFATAKASHSSDQLMHGPFVRLVVSFGSAAPAPIAAPPPPGMFVGDSWFFVFFDFDKSNITAQSQEIIDAAITRIKRANSTKIRLDSHADRSGSEQYNRALSIRRGEAVKAALIRGGIPAADIVVLGRGESAPLVPTPDGVREPQNRRVEILF